MCMCVCERAIERQGVSVCVCVRVRVCVHVCARNKTLFLSFYLSILIDELGEVSLSMCGFVAECRHRCLYPGQ